MKDYSAGVFDFGGVTQEFDQLLRETWKLGDVLSTTIECVLVGVFLLVMYAVLAILLIFMERKVCAYFQCRLGPMRVGPWGIFQVFADVVKMLTKEIFVVDKSDKILYFIAPFLVITASVGAFSFLPWNKGMQVLDFNVGVFLFTALSSIGVVGIFLAGWGSNNKYGVISAVRGAVQMISYEISLGLCILVVVILLGTMQISEMVALQTGPWNWVIFKGHLPALLAFLIFLVAGNAEANRGPFDLAEAESELTAGYHTEYSGMGFGFYYLAEYLNLFIIAGLASTLFLGGWAAVNVGIEKFDYVMNCIPGFFWFMGKTLMVVWLLMWVRWTFPRLRIDQILKMEWKYLIPICLLNLLVMTFVVSLKLYIGN